MELAPRPRSKVKSQCGVRGLASRLMLLTLVGLSGCRAIVEPVPQAPGLRSVFLLDHGRTSSLVLASEDGSMTRYAYGEWRWYAKQETGPLRVFPTLFAKTTATLGRKELPGPPTAANLRRQIVVEIAEMHCLEAPPERVDTLQRRLDTLFSQHSASLLYNETYDLEFVVHPEPYTLWHNSNHVVAEWLRQLGIGVKGSPLLGNWALPEFDRKNRSACGVNPV